MYFLYFFQSLYAFCGLQCIGERTRLFLDTACLVGMMHRKTKSKVKTDVMAAIKVADSRRLKLQTKVFSSRSKKIVFAL